MVRWGLVAWVCLLGIGVGTSQARSSLAHAAASHPPYIPAVQDRFSSAGDVVRLGDGRVVFAGSTFRCDADFGPFAEGACPPTVSVIGRLRADGALDRTFGDGQGVVALGLPTGTTASGLRIVAQPDGRLLAGGGFTPQGASRATLGITRVLPDGAVDGSFGSGGSVVTDFGVSGYVFGDIVLQPDGKILAVGYGYDAVAQVSEILTARYLPDGSLDPSWGTGGKTVTNLDPPGSDYVGLTASRLAVLPDGKVLLAGQRRCNGACGPSGVALFRLEPDGALDSTFGDGGVSEIPSISAGSSQPAKATDLAVTADGRIVVVGSTTDAYAFAYGFSKGTITLYRPDGTLDTAFGGADTGYVTSSCDPFNAVALGPDGTIHAAGQCLSAYTPSGGLLSQVPASTGSCKGCSYSFTRPPLERVYPDGTALTGGSSPGNFESGARATYGFSITRFTQAGLDTSFGQRGSSFIPRIPRCRGRAATIVGTDGRDRLTAAPPGNSDKRADVVVAYGGNDLIDSGDRKDIVCAGTGNDNIFLGNGSDRAFGGPGRDRIRGQAGDDFLFGQSGRDRLFGGLGADTLFGGPGRDVIRQGP